jgi:hypothetical protein
MLIDTDSANINGKGIYYCGVFFWIVGAVCLWAATNWKVMLAVNIIVIGVYLRIMAHLIYLELLRSRISTGEK